MRELLAYATNVFNEDLKALKMQYFPGPASENTDPFDSRSEFIILTSNNTIVAAGRITANPGGPLITETGGLGNFRTTSDTADMGRYFITSNYQGIPGLYEALCLLINDYALQSGFSYANAGVTAGHRLIQRLERIHFTISGPTIPIRTASGMQSDIVPMICNLKEKQESIISDLSQCLRSLKERGVNISKRF